MVVAADVAVVVLDNALQVAEFDDPNIDKEAVILGTPTYTLKYHNINILLEDDSPYPEVRSAVANTDDPEMPVSTIRTWIIGE